MLPTHHYKRAEALLDEGVDAIDRISRLQEKRRKLADAEYEEYNKLTDRMDELGKKAMGIWAQAQVHATLATGKL